MRMACIGVGPSKRASSGTIVVEVAKEAFKGVTAKKRHSVIGRTCTSYAKSSPCWHDLGCHYLHGQDKDYVPAMRRAYVWGVSTSKNKALCAKFGVGIRVYNVKGREPGDEPAKIPAFNPKQRARGRATVQEGWGDAVPGLLLRSWDNVGILEGTAPRVVGDPHPSIVTEKAFPMSADLCADDCPAGRLIIVIHSGDCSGSIPDECGYIVHTASDGKQGRDEVGSVCDANTNDPSLSRVEPISGDIFSYLGKDGTDGLVAADLLDTLMQYGGTHGDPLSAGLLRVIGQIQMYLGKMRDDAEMSLKEHRARGRKDDTWKEAFHLGFADKRGVYAPRAIAVMTALFLHSRGFTVALKLHGATEDSSATYLTCIRQSWAKMGEDSRKALLRLAHGTATFGAVISSIVDPRLLVSSVAELVDPVDTDLGFEGGGPGKQYASCIGAVQSGLEELQKAPTAEPPDGREADYHDPVQEAKDRAAEDAKDAEPGGVDNLDGDAANTCARGLVRSFWRISRAASCVAGTVLKGMPLVARTLLDEYHAAERNNSFQGDSPETRLRVEVTLRNASQAYQRLTKLLRG